MNTALFFFGALIAVTFLLAYLLRRWVKANVGSRWPEHIAPGGGFIFYERGVPQYDVCEQNHADIGVIHTALNKRVEYENVSKL